MAKEAQGAVQQVLNAIPNGHREISIDVLGSVCMASCLHLAS